jgi:tetratricopeptide (TPR) repeat protein
MKFEALPTIADALDNALEAFRSGDFPRAEAEAESALALDFEHPGVQAALKCAVYWKDRVARARSLPAPEQRGDFLLKEWTGFHQRFRAHLDEPFEEGIEAIRGTLFQMAAEAFLEQIGYEEESRKAELLVKAARAYKGNGTWDRALGCLDQVLQGRPDDAGALAEMADCLEAIGETQKSRLFFREAFYLNPQDIEVNHLLSPAIQTLVGALESEGLSRSELKEWLPVHAVVQGVFNVKRDLKPLEVGQLKQGISSLKAETHGGASRGSGVPRLLYRYFWLIDHYLSAKEDRSKIEDLLLNIKLLDERIYELYTH